MGPDPLNYIVLHHTGIAEPHFDLMLELPAEAKLATWRCPHWPPQPGDAIVPLAEHRRDFLTFEGKLTGDRGEVRRVAAGQFKIVENSAREIQIQIESGARIALKKMQK